MSTSLILAVSSIHDILLSQAVFASLGRHHRASERRRLDTNSSRVNRLTPPRPHLPTPRARNPLGERSSSRGGLSVRPDGRGVEGGVGLVSPDARRGSEGQTNRPRELPRPATSKTQEKVLSGPARAGLRLLPRQHAKRREMEAGGEAGKRSRTMQTDSRPAAQRPRTPHHELAASPDVADPAHPPGDDRRTQPAPQTPDEVSCPGGV